MNKTLFEKVKAMCKDTGLSEKYLSTITDKMGGSIEDDSTDDTAIEALANQIAEIAVETQGEATRWANKKKKSATNASKKGEDDDSDDDSDDDDSKNGKNKKSQNTKDDDRIVALQREIEGLKQSKLKSERDSVIKSAQAKHKIPDWRMKGLTIPEDQDPDEFLADIKQDLITQNLIPGDSEGAKAATEKQVDEAADSLLESITAK